MIGAIVKRIVGTKNERELKRMRPAIARINALEAEIQALTDAQLRLKTDEFRKRLADGETIEDILPEAFAVVREASGRTLGMRHFDVQLVGGIVLHEGRIAEMKTGEGKTFVAPLAAYLNGLTGRGVHVVTVNVGDRVRRGTKLGTVGMSGSSTGPHLHYEVLKAGVAVNPRRYIE